MKIIHCPDNQEPPVYARNVLAKRGYKSTFSLREHWWLLAVAIFAVVTFTVGPLKPQRKRQIAPDPPPATAEIANNTALTSVKYDFTGYCRNPGGGYTATGDQMYTMVGETLVRMRCDNGQFQEVP